MMRHSTMLGAVIASCVFASSADAANGSWTSREICSAATAAYFFLHSPPVAVGTVAEWGVFRSEAGNTYDCRLDGKRVRFRWKNDRELMAGGAGFEVDGPVLRVQTDMGKRAYRMGASGWSEVE